MSVKSLQARPVRVSTITTRKVFQTPLLQFHTKSIDFDGDGSFGPSDLRACVKRHFSEIRSLGDGHCFFRVLHRFLKKSRLYTQLENGHFQRVRDRLIGNGGIFPEIAYLRRVAQKFCQKIPIVAYGRNQPASDDAMDYAAESQQYGLSKARNLEMSDGRGYADSPDYEACAVVFNIIICILQSDGKWQVFPDDCLESGFGQHAIMFAYNKGAIHFNALEPNMDRLQQRKLLIESISVQMTVTKQQACRIASYFFSEKTSISRLGDDIHLLQRLFGCCTDTAIEMLHIRIPIQTSLQETIYDERQLLNRFSDKIFIKLLTYGNIETLAGFKTASELVKYLIEKTEYLSQRDGRSFTIQEIANIYLNGD